MGGVPRKHHTKSKVGRRRSHLALTKQHLSVCAQCQAPVRSHYACANCGALPRAAVQAAKPTPAPEV